MLRRKQAEQRKHRVDRCKESNARATKARCLLRRRAEYWGGGRQQSVCLLCRFMQRGRLFGLCETLRSLEPPSQQRSHRRTAKAAKAAKTLGPPSQQRPHAPHTSATQKASKANASRNKVKAERPVSARPEAGENVRQRIALGISVFFARLGSDGLDVKNRIKGLLFSTKTVFRNAAQERSPRSPKDEQDPAQSQYVFS